MHQHVSNKKSLEQTTKKSLQQMTTQMSDAQAAQHKAERECNSLRDSVKSLRDAWAREVKAVREEVKRNEERNKKEREDAVSCSPPPQPEADVAATQAFSAR